MKATLEKQLILASASPRRQQLLQEAGVSFHVDPPKGSEVLEAGEDPERAARRLAVEKAQEVARRNPRALVLAADTLVVVGGDILGKPSSEEEAWEMLRRLSGRTHQVITGVAFVWERVASPFAVTTDVCFRPLGEEEIASYVATREPMDKAGAYGIQGGAAGFVRAIHGSYTNVVGLPVAEVLEWMSRH